MYNGMLHLHSLLRWIILILLLVALYKHFVDRHRPFTAGHKKIDLFLMISCDIMLLLGLYQWISGAAGLKSIQNYGMSDVMKTPALRFFAIEHFTAMLLAIVLVHLGYAYGKKQVPDVQKHKRILWFFGVALLLILISIPWPFREGIGRPLFPGM
jgi:hypothetical protein